MRFASFHPNPKSLANCSKVISYRLPSVIQWNFLVSPLLLNIQGGIELSNYLIVPILLKRHDIPQVFGSTSSHYLIKDRVMLCLHIGLINPLRNCCRLGLGNDHRLIVVLLKCRVKSIVNATFLCNKPWIFFSLFPHQICFALVADFLPPIRVEG
jgi:hypothetical protein